eukprot:5127529-Prymnesium_polylepis.1
MSRARTSDWPHASLSRLGACGAVFFWRYIDRDNDSEKALRVRCARPAGRICAIVLFKIVVMDTLAKDVACALPCD